MRVYQKLINVLIQIFVISSILGGCTVSSRLSAAMADDEIIVNDDEMQTAYEGVSSGGDILLKLHDVPDSYLKPARQAGSVVRFDYRTNTYDVQDRQMSKFAYVYLPYGYDENEERYDVVYTMHGHTGDVTTFIGEPDDPRDMKNLIDHLIENGEMKPMLIVFASYYHDNTEADSDDYDAHLTKQFGQELQNDLIPQFESTYRTYAETVSDEGLIDSRNHRIFMGFSMGAVTTWYRMTDSLRYFRYFVPISGSLYWGDRQTVMEKGYDNPSWIADMLSSMISAQGYAADDFYILSMTGSDDFALDSLRMQIEDMKRHPEMFRFDESTVQGNFSFLIGIGEEHDYHAKRLYFFNALPTVSAMILKRG